MMELTGEIADGAVLNYCVPPEYNIQAMEQLETGAARAGRSLDDIDRPQLIVCSVHEDRKTALDGARELLTQYLAQQPHIAKASGVKPEDRGADPVDPGLAGHQRAGAPGHAAGAGRTGAAHHGQRHAGRRSRPRCASTWTTAPPARSSIRWATSS